VDRDQATRQRAIPLRNRLLAIALAGILPLAFVAGLGLVSIINDQQFQTERRNLEVTRLVATAVEIKLNRSFDVLEALSHSPLLDSGDVDSFSRLVQRVLPSVPDWHALLLIAPDGQVIRRISSSSMSSAGPLAEVNSFTDVVTSEQRQVGDLGKGPGGNWGIPLRVPVMRETELRYVITAVLRPRAILGVISTRRLPTGWMVTVLDGTGRRIGNTHAAVETTGDPAPAALAELLRTHPTEEGMGQAIMEGVPVHTAFVRLQQGAEWTVATGVPTSEVKAGALQATILYGGGLTLSLLLAIAAALIASRRINRPMHQLRLAAQAIGARQTPVAPSSDIEEIQEVGLALLASGQARRESEAERDAMLQNLEQAQHELTQQVSDLEQLQSLGNQLIQLSGLQEQLEAILQVLCSLHGSSHGLVLLSDNNGPLQIRAAQGFSAFSLGQLNATGTSAETLGSAIVAGLRVVIADTETDPRFTPFIEIARTEGFRSVHSTAIKSSGGAVLGALIVPMGEPREPTSREKHLANLCAGLAAVFVDRASIQAEAGVSQQRLQVALESSSIPFSILAPQRDESGEVVEFLWEFINPKGAALLDHSVQELTNAPLGQVLGSWHASRTFHTLVEVIEHNESREIEAHNGKNDTESWLHIVATPFQQRVAVWFADITQRKRQERLIHEADRRKDEFLATLAHELRNPLAPIRMAAQLFGSPTSSDVQKQRSQQIIERQVIHMALLLDDLFDISRITLGKLALRKQSLDLRDIVSAALETARPKLEARRHAFSLDLTSNPVMVEGDPLRLEQIVTNLLTNAAKFTPEGGTVRVQVSYENGFASIAVTDNGMGIAPEHLSTIFEKFAQVSGQSDAIKSGLGIGLALARELAQLHGGQVLASSSGSGQGSTFVVRLPAEDEARPRFELEAPPSHATSNSRILVADDNHDIAETIADILRLEGHEVVLAFDGIEALNLYKRFSPDVALLDIGMPGMRGDEVSKAIRSMPDGDKVLLVAITGWGQPQDKESALAAGFDNHLTKPVGSETILEILKSRRTRR